MIQLLLEAQKGKGGVSEQVEVDTGFATVEEFDLNTNRNVAKREITDLDITAQAMLFFVAGFETVSTAMAFLCYELAINPNVQDKLHDEVQETFRECNGKLTYEKLMKMKYLDMVISGTVYCKLSFMDS